jgi:hypothetical protein
MEVALSSLFTISVSTALQWCCECTFHGVSEGSTYEGAAKAEPACVGGSRSLQSIHDTNSRNLRCCCQDMLTVVSYSVVLHSVAIPAMQFALWSWNQHKQNNREAKKWISLRVRNVGAVREGQDLISKNGFTRMVTKSQYLLIHINLFGITRSLSFFSRPWCELASSGTRVQFHHWLSIWGPAMKPAYSITLASFPPPNSGSGHYEIFFWSRRWSPFPEDPISDHAEAVATFWLATNSEW